MSPLRRRVRGQSTTRDSGLYGTSRLSRHRLWRIHITDGPHDDRLGMHDSKPTWRKAMHAVGHAAAVGWIRQKHTKIIASWIQERAFWKFHFCTRNTKFGWSMYRDGGI